MGSGPNWDQIGNNTCYIVKVSKFYIKKISMLADLKVSSLAYKRVFFGPEHDAKGEPKELNFEGFEIHKLSTSMDRAKRLDDVICHLSWGHLSSYHVYSQNYGL